MHRYGWTSWDVGMSLCAVGLGAAIVQGGLTRRLVPRLGEARSLQFGLSLGVLAYLGYALAAQGWMIYAVIAVASLGAIAMPACQAMITRTVPVDQQGQTQGALAGLNNLANIAGPLLGANVFAWSIDPAHDGRHPGTVYFVSAALAVASLLVAAHTLRRHPPTRATPNQPPR
jgi:DHA1 family tetracycline resistance protein-like MFS transporter